MINFLKDCLQSTAIGMLPDIINHNNEAIKDEFNWFFDSSLNRLTKSVYVPTGSVKAHFGEFVNLACEYITIKNADSLKPTLREKVQELIKEEGILHKRLVDRFVTTKYDVSILDLYAHDAENIIFDVSNSVYDKIDNLDISTAYLNDEIKRIEDTIVHYKAGTNIEISNENAISAKGYTYNNNLFEVLKLKVNKDISCNDVYCQGLYLSNFMSYVSFLAEGGFQYINDGKIGEKVVYGIYPTITEIEKVSPTIVSITAPNCIYVKDEAFYECITLKELNLPNVEMIGNGSFALCKQLIDIKFPHVKSIGDTAFGTCTSLLSFDCPECISIGNKIFDLCNQLTYINLPSLTTIEGDFLVDENKSTIKYINISGLTIIKDYMFKGCTSLTEIVLSNTLSSINEQAFVDCISLASIRIPDSVKIIEKYAFVGCTSLTHIVLGKGLNDISVWAFDNCSSLNSMVILNEDSIIDLQCDLPSSIKIYVPQNLKNKYIAEGSPWKQYNNIIPFIPIPGLF